jgi:hypothetical protein
MPDETPPKGDEDIIEDEELDLSEDDLSDDNNDDDNKDDDDKAGEDEETDDDDDPEVLEEVLSKEVKDLTDEDKALIKKHGEHLSDANKDKFQEIIEGSTEEYTKERFNGLMSRMNKKIDNAKNDFDKQIETLKREHAEEIKKLNKTDNDNLTPEEKQAKLDEDKGVKFVKDIMEKDPAFKKFKESQNKEEQLDKIIEESDEQFKELDKISNQDFKDPKVQKKYYELASKYGAELKIPVNVYAAFKLEQDRKKSATDTEHKIKKDTKRRKDADLKPKAKGAGGKTPKAFDPATSTEAEMWDSVEEDMRN